MINQEINTKLLEFQKQIQKIKKEVDDFVFHQHTGFDSSKVSFKDLRTIFYTQKTINPANLVDGAGETIQITGVSGATLGDFVLVSAPYDLQDITVTAYVQANTVVEIRIQNESGNTVDLASGMWRILIIRKII